MIYLFGEKKTQREINFVSMYIKNVHLDVFVNKTLQIVYIHSFLVYRRTWLMIVLSLFLFFLKQIPISTLSLIWPFYQKSNSIFALFWRMLNKKNRLPIDNDIERIRQTFHIIKRQESLIDKNQSLDYPPKPSASQSRV